LSPYRACDLSITKGLKGRVMMKGRLV
jgi:hypothetical protein